MPLPVGQAAAVAAPSRQDGGAATCRRQDVGAAACRRTGDDETGERVAVRLGSAPRGDDNDDLYYNSPYGLCPSPHLTSPQWRLFFICTDRVLGRSLCEIS